jgi:S1-C subfamily serine protease
MGLANTSNRSGVLVQAPQPGGLAALLSLQPGDRLVYVNNRLVREASEWHWAMGMAEQDVRDGLSALLSVQVMRGSNRVVVYVPIVLQ